MAAPWLANARATAPPTPADAPVTTTTSGSGIGFLGGGIIFVRRDTVRGLTTAVGVWMTAALGMRTCGSRPVPDAAHILHSW